MAVCLIVNLVLGTKLSINFKGGTIMTYEIPGKVELKDYLPDPIGNLTGIVVFADNKIYVNNVNGAVRKGLVQPVLCNMNLKNSVKPGGKRTDRSSR